MVVQIYNNIIKIIDGEVEEAFPILALRGLGKEGPDENGVSVLHMSLTGDPMNDYVLDGRDSSIDKVYKDLLEKWEGRPVSAPRLSVMLP